MKQALLRKTLTGDWEEFAFSEKGRFFEIKNNTNGDIYVSFENEDLEEESFKLKAGERERIAISWNSIEREIYYTKSVFVKGTGEVEVRSLDTATTIVNKEIDVKGGKLELGLKDTIKGDTIEIGSPNIEIENHNLVIN